MASQSNAVTKRTVDIPAAVSEQLQSVMPSIGRLLPSDITLDQFRAAMMIHLYQTKGLIGCTPESIASATIKAATDGLLPGRDCHFTPRKVKGVETAIYVPDYRGLILALERTGKVRKAFSQPVYSKEKFMVDYLADEFSHVPIMGPDKGELVCFYACIIMRDGTKHVDVMDLEAIDRIKRRSPASDSGPWNTDYNEMGKKTVLKRLCKYVQVSPELTAIIERDDKREEEDFNPQRGATAAEELFPEPPKIERGNNSIIPTQEEELPHYILNSLIGLVEEYELNEAQINEVATWRMAAENPKCPEATIERFIELATEALARLEAK